MSASGELPALILTALCNFVLQRFADLQPAWDKAPDDLDERIAYVPLGRDTAEQVEEGQRYQYVADTPGTVGAGGLAGARSLRATDLPAYSRRSRR